MKVKNFQNFTVIAVFYEIFFKNLALRFALKKNLFFKSKNKNKINKPGLNK